jgi:hypothetical protein
MERAMRIKADKRYGTHAVLDSDGLCVNERAEGYFWKLKGVRREHGPFESLVDALDDIQRRVGSDLIGEPEDWIDDVGYEAAYPEAVGLEPV